MKKKILAIYYSQTGQLHEVITQFTAVFHETDYTTELVRISPEKDYPFPWTTKRFYDVMPGAVLDQTIPLQPYLFNEEAYDLIILGYQPWFLSPSTPFTSLLLSSPFKEIIKNTPIVTICCARNMWLNAFERIKAHITKMEGNLVGNIALVDRNHNYVSFITIFYWMLKGKKERLFHLFPKPGISEKDLLAASDYGILLKKHLENGTLEKLQEDYIRHGAVFIKYSRMFTERRAKPIYKFWANLILRKKNKTAWLTAFKYYLLVALFFGAPVLLLVDFIFIKPFSAKKISFIKHNYLAVK